MLPRALVWIRCVGSGGTSLSSFSRWPGGRYRRLSPGRILLLLLLLSAAKLFRWCRCLAVVFLLLAVSIPHRWWLLPPESEISVLNGTFGCIHVWRLWWGLSSLVQIIVAWYGRGGVDGLKSSFGRQVFVILGLSTQYLRLCRLLWLGRRGDISLDLAIGLPIWIYIVGMIGVRRLIWSIILTLLTLTAVAFLCTASALRCSCSICRARTRSTSTSCRFLASVSVPNCILLPRGTWKDPDELALLVDRPSSPMSLVSLPAI